jgi:hypothetical protein
MCVLDLEPLSLILYRGLNEVVRTATCSIILSTDSAEIWPVTFVMYQRYYE